MRTRILRGLAVLAVAALTAVSRARAQPDPPDRYLPAPEPGPRATPVLSPLVPDPAAADQPATVPPAGEDPGPAACFGDGACLADGASGIGRLFVLGEYLYWKPRSRDLDYAILSPVNDGSPQGSIQSLDWQASSGFRAGGGYLTAKGWDVGTYYTYLHSSSNANLTAAAGGALFATLTHPGLV